MSGTSRDVSSRPIPLPAWIRVAGIIAAGASCVLGAGAVPSSDAPQVEGRPATAPSLAGSAEEGRAARRTSSEESGYAGAPRLAVVLVVAGLRPELLEIPSPAEPDDLIPGNGEPLRARSEEAAVDAEVAGVVPAVVGGWLRGGLRRLDNEGVRYIHARAEAAVASRCAGLATLATGAPPGLHGIPSDSWIGGGEAPREVRAWQEDGPALVVPGTSIPSGPGEGVGPEQLRSTTLADSLVLDTSGVGKAWSVSADPAGAVLTAGRLGKAIWISERTKTVASSTRYFPRRGSFPPRLPAWLDAMESQTPPEGAGAQATTGSPPAMASDDPASSTDRLVDLALAVVEKEGLGDDAVPDILWLAIDPGFLRLAGGQDRSTASEARASLLASLRTVDRAVGRLLAALDRLPAGRGMFVLTADRGGPLPPLTVGDGALPDSVLEPSTLADSIEERLDRTVRSLDWVLGTTPGGIWLNPRSVAASRRSAIEIERLAASAIWGLDGIERVVLRGDVAIGALPRDETSLAIERSFWADRFPDLLIVPRFRCSWRDPSGELRSPSPHAYDSHVPLVFASPALAPRLVARRVSQADLAPTLAVLLRVSLPSASRGDVLPEIAER